MFGGVELLLRDCDLIYAKLYLKLFVQHDTSGIITILSFNLVGITNSGGFCLSN